MDGQIHRSWKAELVRQNDSLLTFIGKFDCEIQHQHLGVIRRGTISYEFYWLDRWYNIFRFQEPNGELRNFYCNVNMPPLFKNGVLDYVDLDIDIVVWRDFSFEILDLDEFEENSEKYKYARQIHLEVNKSLNKLKKMINEKQFPFDG